MLRAHLVKPCKSEKKIEKGIESSHEGARVLQGRREGWLHPIKNEIAEEFA